MSTNTKKKSPYDEYMDEATNIYNQQKQQNIDQANNQSALAHAQYQEVNRNLNEINKAKGLNNTGYEGDTQVNAYNAYRNAVNSANANAQSTNNQLYSYYLQEMMNLQNAKDTQANYEWEKEYKEREYNDTKINQVIGGIDTLKGENSYDENGNITEDSAQRLWKYVTDIYGDNVPAEIIAELNTEKGFDKWVDVYNNSYKTTGNAQGNQPVVEPSDQQNTQTNNKQWEITGLGSGRNNDNITFKFGDEEFDLQTGNKVCDDKAKELNKLVTGKDNLKANEYIDDRGYKLIKWSEGNFIGATANSTDTPERLVVQGKKMYLYTSKGWVEVKSRNDNVYDAIEAYLK